MYNVSTVGRIDVGIFERDCYTWMYLISNKWHTLIIITIHKRPVCLTTPRGTPVDHLQITGQVNIRIRAIMNIKLTFKLFPYHSDMYMVVSPQISHRDAPALDQRGLIITISSRIRRPMPWNTYPLASHPYEHIISFYIHILFLLFLCMYNSQCIRHTRIGRRLSQLVGYSWVSVTRNGPANPHTPFDNTFQPPILFLQFSCRHYSIFYALAKPVY
jgi:hypothetical protein